jgi:hypothetical protein
MRRALDQRYPRNRSGANYINAKFLRPKPPNDDSDVSGREPEFPTELFWRKPFVVVRRIEILDLLKKLIQFHGGRKELHVLHRKRFGNWSTIISRVSFGTCVTGELDAFAVVNGLCDQASRRFPSNHGSAGGNPNRG